MVTSDDKRPPEPSRWDDGDKERGAAGHILVVDDNQINRLMAERMCDMQGFTCEFARNGLEAVEAVRRRAFDMILMDICMPEMDGVEATRAIRAMPSLVAETPIIAVTAHAQPEEAVRYFQAGMCWVIEKPIKVRQLFEVIRGLIKTQRATRPPALAGEDSEPVALDEAAAL